MALIQVDDSNFQKISNFTNVPPDQIQDTDLITGLHNGGNANFRIYDIVSKVMAGIDIDPGQDPGYDPGGDLGEQVTYSVIIDESKSDPGKMCVYANDAIGFNGRNGWTNLKNKPIFKKIKNCVLNNGTVLYYLNPDNVAEKEDGTAADITTLGNDVMIEIGERVGYRIVKLDENRIEVSVTNRANAAGFCYDAFSYSGYNDCSQIYIGKYKGFVSNGMMYSSSGRQPTVNQTLSTFRGYARARGSGYEQRWYGSVLLMQCLYLVALCNLDSQSVVGQGYTGASAARTTGGANTYGMCNQNSPNKGSATAQVQCMGLEDFWGNVHEWVEGIQTGSSRQILLYNFGGATEWEDLGNMGITSNLGGYLSKVRGDKSGFVPTQVSGSASTKYCDGGYLYASRVAYFGGIWSGGASAGAFRLDLDGSASVAYSYIGARLMYFKRG